MLATVSRTTTAAALINLAASKGLRVKARPFIKKGVRTFSVAPVTPVSPAAEFFRQCADEKWDFPKVETNKEKSKRQSLSVYA